ncbi:MAG: hypothetical protein M1822_005197 [Bathelium mastoideum]|nr:MAG: hypothetical protein M1822_005197 [Bathelium mastoideum]
MDMSTEDDTVSPGSEDFKPDDIFIAVMGVTGAGKSSFISLCTEEEVEIGHNLQACTQEVAPFLCKYRPDINVYLIDTPGFDDTNRTDAEVLKELAAWLTEMYRKDLKLNGIIYLHRITDVRMQGSAKLNLFTFKKLCGPNALKHVVLATTMWENVHEEVGADRERELEETPEFWGWMLQHESKMMRHANNRESAMRLIEHFVSKPPLESKVILDLQVEMVEQGKELDETNAGKEVEGALKQELKKAQKSLAEQEENMQEAIKTRDVEAKLMLEEEKVKIDNHIKILIQQQEDLRISAERLYEEKMANMTKQLEESRQEQERQRSLFEEERRRREEATKKSHEEITQLRSELSELSLNPHVRSHPSQNRIADWPVTVSLYKNYCFCVAANRDLCKPPSNFPEERQSAANGNRCVALGQNDSWYVRYRDFQTNEDHTVFSSNFQSLYPQAYVYLHDQHPNDEPTCVSLGAKGYYFVRTSSGCSYNLPKEVESHLKEPSTFESVWIGKDNAYVAQRKEKTSDNKRQAEWRLQGYYMGLPTVLSRITPKIKALAMNPLDINQFIVIFEDGSVVYRAGETHRLDKFEFEEHCSNNFGTTWSSNARNAIIALGKGAVSADSAARLQQALQPKAKQRRWKFWKRGERKK